jgi:hypothetical protein
MSNARALELARRHGNLKARIDQQRQQLATQVLPLEAALARGDAVLHGVDWLKHHPGAIGAAVAAAVVLRPRRAWAWAKRGFFVWRGWQALRNSVFGKG